MRDLKFRAWDLDKKKWIEVDKYSGRGIADGRILELIVQEEDEVTKTVGFKEYKGNYEIMLFTGLKDKKGTEIYEGDILIWSNPRMDEQIRKIGNYPDDTEVAKQIVIKWKEGGFIFEHELLSASPLSDLTDMTPCKVAANIYENPEWLEDDE